VIFLYFADRAFQYIYLNINQLDGLNLIMSFASQILIFCWPCISIY